MYKSKKVTAIILAAGSGTRMNSKQNKVYLELQGIPIIKYSIEKFLKNKYIDEIILVIKQGEEELCLGLGYEIKTIHGGLSRQESVYNALKEAKGEITIIHDAARPFITEEYINNCIETMGEFSAVTIGVKEKNTIKLTNASGIVVETIDRSKAWQIQTPQCFNKELLLKAHEQYKNSKINITDDCMLMELIGEKVKIIEGEYTNIKITTKEDIFIADNILNNI